MFFDMMELTTTYMQYLYLLIRMCPDQYPSFVVEPYYRMTQLALTILSGSSNPAASSPYTVASFHLPEWLPYNFVLQFGVICVVVPLILSTLGVLGVAGKVAYVKLLVLLTAFFMMVFGSALLTGHYPSSSYDIISATTRIVCVALGTPMFLFLTVISLYVGYRGLMRQYRCERVFFGRMLEEERHERAAYSNTESISNREKISLVALAVHRTQVQHIQQSIARFSVRDALVQHGFVAILIVLVLFVYGAVPLGTLAALPRTILVRVLGAVLGAVALLCEVWFALSLWRGGRALRHRISRKVYPVILTIILFCLSFLYTMMVTNFVLILYCETITCRRGTRFHAQNSVFPLASNDKKSIQAQCIAMDLHAYPQRCSVELQTALQNDPKSENRLVYDSSVDCAVVTGFIATGAALVFASYIVLVPLLMFVLARYSVRVLRTEYPVEQRLKDTFSERELYSEKVSRSDNPAQNVFRAYKLEYRYYSLSFTLQKFILALTSCIMQAKSMQEWIWAGNMIFCAVTSVAAGCAMHFRPFARPTETVYFPVLQLMVALTSLYGFVISRFGMGETMFSVGILLVILLLAAPLVTIVVGTILTLRKDRTQQEKLRRRLESRFSKDIVRHQRKGGGAVGRRRRQQKRGGENGNGGRPRGSNSSSSSSSSSSRYDSDPNRICNTVGNRGNRRLMHRSHVGSEVEDGSRVTSSRTSSPGTWIHVPDSPLPPSRCVSVLDGVVAVSARAHAVVPRGGPTSHTSMTNNDSYVEHTNPRDGSKGSDNSRHGSNPTNHDGCSHYHKYFTSHGYGSADRSHHGNSKNSSNMKSCFLPYYSNCINDTSLSMLVAKSYDVLGSSLASPQQQPLAEEEKEEKEASGCRIRLCKPVGDMSSNRYDEHRASHCQNSPSNSIEEDVSRSNFMDGAGVPATTHAESGRDIAHCAAPDGAAQTLIENGWICLRAVIKRVRAVYNIIIGGSDLLYNEVDAETPLSSSKNTNNCSSKSTTVAAQSESARRRRKRARKKKPKTNRSNNNNNSSSSSNHINHHANSIRQSSHGINSVRVMCTHDNGAEHESSHTQHSPHTEKSRQTEPTGKNSASAVGASAPDCAAHVSATDACGVAAPRALSASAAFSAPIATSDGLANFLSTTFDKDTAVQSAPLRGAWAVQPHGEKEKNEEDANRHQQPLVFLEEKRNREASSPPPRQRHSISFKPHTDAAPFAALRGRSSKECAVPVEDSHTEDSSRSYSSSSSDEDAESARKGEKDASIAETMDISQKMPHSWWWWLLCCFCCFGLSRRRSSLPRKRDNNNNSSSSNSMAERKEAQQASNVEYPTSGFVFVPSLYFVEKCYPIKTGRRRGRLLPWRSRTRRDDTSPAGTVAEPDRVATNATMVAGNATVDVDSISNIIHNMSSINTLCTNPNGSTSSGSITKTTGAVPLGDALTRFVFPQDGAAESAPEDSLVAQQKLDLTTSAALGATHSTMDNTSNAIHHDGSANNDGKSGNANANAVDVWPDSTVASLSSARPLTFADMARVRVRAQAQAALSLVPTAHYTRPYWHHTSEDCMSTVSASSTVANSNANTNPSRKNDHVVSEQMHPCESSASPAAMTITQAMWRTMLNNSCYNIPAALAPSTSSLLHDSNSANKNSSSCNNQTLAAVSVTGRADAPLAEPVSLSTKDALTGPTFLPVEAAAAKEAVAVTMNTARSNLFAEDPLALSASLASLATSSSFLAAVRARLRRRSSVDNLHATASGTTAAAAARTVPPPPPPPPLDLESCFSCVQRQFTEMCGWWTKHELPIPVATWTPKKKCAAQWQGSSSGGTAVERPTQSAAEARSHHRSCSSGNGFRSTSSYRSPAAHTLTRMQETELAKMTLEAHTREMRNRRRLRISTKQHDDEEEDASEARAAYNDYYHYYPSKNFNSNNINSISNNNSHNVFLSTRGSDVQQQHLNSDATTPSLSVSTQVPSSTTRATIHNDSYSRRRNSRRSNNNQHSTRSNRIIRSGDRNSSSKLFSSSTDGDELCDCKDGSTSKKADKQHRAKKQQNQEDSNAEAHNWHLHSRTSNTPRRVRSLPSLRTTYEPIDGGKDDNSDSSNNGMYHIYRHNNICKSNGSYVRSSRITSVAGRHERTQTAVLLASSGADGRILSRSTRDRVESPSRYASKLNTIMSIMAGPHSVHDEEDDDEQCEKDACCANNTNTSTIASNDNNDTYSKDEYAKDTNEVSFPLSSHTEEDADQRGRGQLDSRMHPRRSNSDASAGAQLTRQSSKHVVLGEPRRFVNDVQAANTTIGNAPSARQEDPGRWQVDGSFTTTNNIGSYNGGSSNVLDEEGAAIMSRDAHSRKEGAQNNDDTTQIMIEHCTASKTSNANTAPPSPSSTVLSRRDGEHDSEKDAWLLRRLRYHRLLRDYFLRGYWFNKKRLKSVQLCIDGKIFLFTERAMRFFLIFLGFVTSCAFALILSGLLSSSNVGNFISAAETAKSTVSSELAGYRSWSEFTSNCCCVAATKLIPQNPFFAIDAEDWLCANGKVKERIRRRVGNGVGYWPSDGDAGVKNAVEDGYAARALCGMEFTPGCQVKVYLNSDEVMLQCTDGDMPSYVYELW